MQKRYLVILSLFVLALFIAGCANTVGTPRSTPTPAAFQYGKGSTQSISANNCGVEVGGPLYVKTSAGRECFRLVDCLSTSTKIERTAVYSNPSSGTFRTPSDQTFDARIYLVASEFGMYCQGARVELNLETDKVVIVGQIANKR